IGCVGAAEPRGDREHRAALVVWPGELRLEAGACDLFNERFRVMRDVGFHPGVAVGHRCELAQFLGARAKTLPPLQTSACTSKALEDRLRALPVLAEVRLG